MWRHLRTGVTLALVLVIAHSAALVRLIGPIAKAAKLVVSIR